MSTYEVRVSGTASLYANPIAQSKGTGKTVQLYLNNGRFTFDSSLYPSTFKSCTLSFYASIIANNKGGYNASPAYFMEGRSVSSGNNSYSITTPYAGYSVGTNATYFPVYNGTYTSGKEVFYGECRTTSIYMTFVVSHADPTISSLATVGTLWEQPIVVSWISDNQTAYEYECYYNNVVVRSGSGTTGKSFTIPANTYAGTGSASVRVRTKNVRQDGVTVYSSWASKSLSLSNITPAISSFTNVGTNIDDAIRLDWESTNQTKWKIEVLEGSTVKNTYSGTSSTLRTRTIAARSITFFGSASIRLSIGYTGLDNVDRWVTNTKTITLTRIAPSISSLASVGTLWEQPIVLNWLSEYQSKFEVTVLKAGSVVKTYTGATAKTYTIASGQLSEGTHTFRVRVAYAGSAGDSWSSYATVTSNLQSITPSISSFTNVGTNIDSTIRLDWESTNQAKWKIEVLEGATVKNTYSGTGSSKTYTIPATSIKFFGSATIRLSIGYTGLDGVDRWVTNSKSITLTRVIASVSNVLVNGEFWEQPLTVTWTSSDQSKYELSVLKNNVVVKTYTGTTAKTHTINANELTDGEHTFRVRVAYVGAAGDAWSGYATKNVTLKDIEATVSSLIVTGEYYEKPIGVSWQSNNQEAFRVDVYKNNIIVKSYTGTVEKSYTIQQDELSDGYHTFRVTVAYQDRYVNYIEKSVDLKTIYPSVSNLQLSGSNIDYALTASWISENQEKYEFIVVDVDNETYINLSGLTYTQYTFAVNTLRPLFNTFRLRVGFRDRWSEWLEIGITLTETLPSIGVLEPDGRIENKDDSIRIYWTSLNQTRWKVEVGAYTYTGTTETEKYLTAGILPTGTTSLRLTVYLDINETSKQISKEVDFIVRGVPPSPTITSPENFSTNRPVFTWDTQDQNAYQLIVQKDGTIIYDTGWNSGLIVQHKMNDYIIDGSYVVSVRVKNIFAELSPYSSKYFSVSTQLTTRVKLKAYNYYDKVKLTWSDPNNEYTTHYVYRNGIKIHVTSSHSYIDNTAQGGNVYKIRSVTSSDIYSDTAETYVYVDLNFPILSTTEKRVELMYRNTLSDLNVNIDNRATKVFVQGRNKPIALTNLQRDKTVVLSVAEIGSENRLDVLDIVSGAESVLYRSNTHKLWLVFDTVAYNDLNVAYVYTLSAFEVNNSEEVDYLK